MHAGIACVGLHARSSGTTPSGLISHPTRPYRLILGRLEIDCRLYVPGGVRDAKSPAMLRRQALAVDQVGERISVCGVVAGDTNRLGLFKRSDPRIGFSGRRRFLAVLGERLERLKEPALAFYASVRLRPSRGLGASPESGGVREVIPRCRTS